MKSDPKAQSKPTSKRKEKYDLNRILAPKKESRMNHCVYLYSILAPKVESTILVYLYFMLAPKK